MKKLLAISFATIINLTLVSTALASGAGIAPNSTTALTQANATPTPVPPGYINPDLILLPTGFAPNLTALLTSMLSVVIAVVALLVFFYLVWGGFSWITSGGDKGKTEQARGKILAAVIGLIIVASSYAILNVLVRLLGYPSLTAVFDAIVPISGTGSVAPLPPPTLTPTATPTPTITPTPN